VGLNFYLICLTCYVPKWNILLITRTIGICLIYMPSPSGLQPSGLGIYIRQIPLAHVITISYVSYIRVMTSSQRPVQYYNDFIGLFLLGKPKNLEVRGINWGTAKKPRLHVCNFPSHFCCSRSIFTDILKQMDTNVHRVGKVTL